VRSGTCKWLVLEFENAFRHRLKKNMPEESGLGYAALASNERRVYWFFSSAEERGAYLALPRIQRERMLARSSSVSCKVASAQASIEGPPAAIHTVKKALEQHPNDRQLTSLLRKYEDSISCMPCENDGTELTSMEEEPQKENITVDDKIAPSMLKGFKEVAHGGQEEMAYFNDPSWEEESAEAAAKAASRAALAFLAAERFAAAAAESLVNAHAHALAEAEGQELVDDTEEAKKKEASEKEAILLEKERVATEMQEAEERILEKQDQARMLAALQGQGVSVVPEFFELVPTAVLSAATTAASWRASDGPHPAGPASSQTPNDSIVEMLLYAADRGELGELAELLRYVAAKVVAADSALLAIVQPDLRSLRCVTIY
jgi:primosomal protein N'